MNAFVFLCDRSTEPECLERLLFGTNPGPFYEQFLSNVREGDYLFLWNYKTYVLRGPFTALTKCEANIESNAWVNSPGHPRGFPFQVRVGAVEEYSKPVGADDLAQARLLHPTKLGLMPPAMLDPSQLQVLLDLFRAKNGDTRPLIYEGKLALIPGREDFLGTAFIFKCDRTTGGRCFSENVMGAPVQAFRSVVSNVQSGATVFLWQLNERKLYGKWKASTRGQYDPTAFPEAVERSFHAVVHCTREMNLSVGIDENALRGIVAYDGSIPPYRIDQQQADRITDALLLANHAMDTDLASYERKQGEGFLAEDGHCVRSQGELIIDNMLFSQRRVHAYEKRVQVGGRYLRCDFYLPPSGQHREVYIEYWGMLQEPAYAKRRQQKLEIYAAVKIDPLELFPRDIAALSEVWPAKLERYRGA
jgi:hypothetical protein